MPAKDPVDKDNDTEPSGLPVVLGHPDGGTASGAFTAEALHKLTLRQLLDWAKGLGLTAVSKLKKEALIGVLLEAWHNRPAANRADDLAPGSSPSATLDDAPESDQTPPRSHKFEVGEPGRIVTEESQHLLRESSKEIPWGYGRDRVTAMPVDPDRLFAYWEVLDDSIAAARGRLGPGGPDAWLSLRVYDTTGRLFDGTNAHSFFDHRIERGDRQWFFPIGRPTSQLVVEIGMKSIEGYFVKIARSGRVEFPRREPAPWSEPEWLTVRVSTGQKEYAGSWSPGRPGRPAAAVPSSVAAPAPALAPAPFAAPSDPLPAGGMRRVGWQDALHVAGGGGVERHEWQEVHFDGPIEEHRRFRWDGPTTITSWEAGPFTYPVEIPEPVREAFAGKTRVMRVGSRTHVVYGPWHVVIRGLGAQQSRVMLSRWEVYRTWAEETGHHVEQFATALTGGVLRSTSGASERMVGASERRWFGGSEARLAGASEVFFLKASELRLGGASETMFAGASQWSTRGASERLFAGASELRRRGASERLYAGASELRLGGASERLLERGALGGGSELRLSASYASGAQAHGGFAAGGQDAYPPPPAADSGAEDNEIS